MKIQSNTLTASMIIAIVAASGLAGAAPEDKQKRRKDILRGPAVNQTTDSSRDSMNPSDTMQLNSEKKGDRAKGKDAKRDAKMGQDRPVSIREYFGALRQMQGADTGAAIEISDEQREEIRSIMSEHREAMKAFQEKHKEQIEQMRQQAKAAKEKAGGELSEDQRAKMRQVQEKARAMFENAPANKAALAKMKSVLSADQFSAISKHAHAMRAKKMQGQRRDRAQRGEQGAAENTDRPQRRELNKRSVDGDSVQDQRRKRPAKKGSKRANPDD